MSQIVFLEKIDLMGKSQASILEKIYQQSLVSTKAVDEVRVEMAKSSSRNIMLSQKIDRVLMRVETIEGANTSQEKKIAAMERDMAIIKNFLKKVSSEKGFKFLNFNY